MDERHPILIVEDNAEDLEVTKRAFAKAGLLNPLFHCEDGDEALDFLKQRGVYSDPARAPRPALILLDLNLPGTDGREVLKEIRAEPSLRRIPVIVLTTSSDERDVESCYDLGANTYIQKPVDLTRFFDAAARLGEYWFQIAMLPR